MTQSAASCAHSGWKHARPSPDIVWTIDGAYSSLSCLKEKVAAEMVVQAESSSSDFGLGYGGNGVITKLGPKGGGGPVGGPDAIFEQALETDLQLEERWLSAVAAPPPGGSCLPSDTYCPAGP